MAESLFEERTFEQALLRLEEVVHDLECGQIGLEESLARYEEGVKLLKGCYTQLAGAEKRILELVGQDENGNALTRPFDHRASAEKKP
jgi:exodeoxyribonuclease VII small subunit